MATILHQFPSPQSPLSSLYIARALRLSLAGGCKSDAVGRAKESCRDLAASALFLPQRAAVYLDSSGFIMLHLNSQLLEEIFF